MYWKNVCLFTQDMVVERYLTCYETFFGATVHPSGWIAIKLHVFNMEIGY